MNDRVKSSFGVIIRPQRAASCDVSQEPDRAWTSGRASRRLTAKVGFELAAALIPRGVDVSVLSFPIQPAAQDGEAPDRPGKLYWCA